MLEPFKASYVAAALFGAALTLGQASGAELATDARAAAIHFGHVIGSAGTCIFIPVPRVVTANAKIRDLLGRFAAGHPEAPDLRDAFDQGMAVGMRAGLAGRPRAKSRLIPCVDGPLCSRASAYQSAD